MSVSDRVNAIEQVMESVYFLKRSFLSRSTGSHKTGLSLPPAKWRVLALLFHKPHSIKELSQELGVSSSATTQLVNELCTSGEVARTHTTTDARITCVVLTPKGGLRFKKIQAPLARELEKLFIPLSDREFAEFVRLLQKIVAPFNNK